MKARIEQLHEDVSVVMEGRSQEVQKCAAPTPCEMVKEHDELYHKYYSWLRDAKRSNVEGEAA